MGDRQVLFILGMGRSGSSALTRVLSLCGGSLPEPLLGSGPGNPTGHWEPLDALKMNDEFLMRHGSGWWDPPCVSKAISSLTLRSGKTLSSKSKDFFGTARPEC